MKLIFATNNRHKVEEVQAAIGNIVEIIPLQEAGIDIDIPEPHDTLEANASEKSRTIYKLTGLDCFSEDTGLETAALHGEPGVRSARYAGEKSSYQENTEKLMEKLRGQLNRSAKFRTIISLILNGKECFFEGICEGEILTTGKGDKGFGYDPVFMPTGSTLSFAEMSTAEKNRFSHRKKAADKLISFLKEQLTATHLMLHFSIFYNGF
jgi:XTP/dITP diphosphohydrolase